MTDKWITTISERGQTSIPALIRRVLGLKAGQRLIWSKVSDREVRIVRAGPEECPGPTAALGYARKFIKDSSRTSDELLSEVREGERDE